MVNVERMAKKLNFTQCEVEVLVGEVEMRMGVLFSVNKNDFYSKQLFQLLQVQVRSAVLQLSHAPSFSSAPCASQPSSGRVLTDAVLQMQRDTITAINDAAKELREIKNCPFRAKHHNERINKYMIWICFHTCVFVFLFFFTSEASHPHASTWQQRLAQMAGDRGLGRGQDDQETKDWTRWSAPENLKQYDLISNYVNFSSEVSVSLHSEHCSVRIHLAPSFSFLPPRG